MRDTVSRLARLTGASMAASSLLLLTTMSPAAAAPITITDHPASVPAGGTIEITATCDDEFHTANLAEVRYSRVSADQQEVNFHINGVILSPPDADFTDSYDTSGIGTPNPGDKYTVSLHCYVVVGGEVTHLIGDYGPVDIQIANGTTPTPTPTRTPTTPTPSTTAPTATPSTPQATSTGTPTSAPPADGENPPQLPVTGTPTGLIVAAGVVMLGAGAVALTLIRRRTTS
ncbi:LPXTG cell wall anchor domain-containing protein [Polymorphospora rubra]|uniref:Gram-positive cocci surface proteins LPxTG domain-containing protein n=1 Tax=Polymorphospora rubra TaxID=338584 RepID=A0A810N7A1_9ACTN|nr:LPXTG cell wall anchor domain-containing protein [Polymorphospora rubra]BCJ69276.1 hypothetical protein Prubr_62970 [Polymorphospora rubra]